MTDPEEPGTCYLALVLLSADERCGKCGHLAGSHKAWHAERERNGTAERERRLLEADVVIMPALWMTFGQALEDIPCGSMVQMRLDTGHVKCARMPLEQEATK